MMVRGVVVVWRSGAVEIAGVLASGTEEPGAVEKGSDAETWDSIGHARAINVSAAAVRVVLLHLMEMFSTPEHSEREALTCHGWVRTMSLLCLIRTERLQRGSSSINAAPEAT